MEDITIDSKNFYGSNSEILESSSNNIKEIFNTNIDTIQNKDNYNDYFCTGCLKFPFIQFCKDRKNIRLTCSCFNNKKISIEELFKINSIENSVSNFLSDTNINVDYEDELICKEHDKKYVGFSKFFLNNYCEECFNDMDKFDENDIIKFEDIKIDEKKIEELNNKINDNNMKFEETSKTISISKESNKYIKMYMINDNNWIQLSEEEEKRFKKLIKIIIDNYKNYPNFSHFLNMKNLLDFFNIEYKSIEKEGNITFENLIDENEPIIIEYNNNISNETKLFSKIFVKNNKKNFKIEIEGEIRELVEKYEFRTKEKIVRVKLYANKNISEINMYKMFSNCINLTYVNGISKLKKIINLNKIFYNCISLSSIPDFNDWEIRKYNAYLMFYNCISFIFFPYEKELNINKYDEGFLGILITKYLKYNKEIIISNINIDREGYINIFKNRFKFDGKTEEIIILDAKDDERELITCLKNDKKEDNEDLTILYKNENNDNGNEITIKLRIINKMKDMKEIIEREELTKWNINKVTNLGRLFYNCKSLKYLPDISNWNINNVTNLGRLFCNCESLKSLPDISKWNTNKVTKIDHLFYECKSLSSLPDLSKWNINNVTNMEYLFCECKCLSSLPDISKWNTDNVTNMKSLFCDCRALLSLPDISKWNTDNVLNIDYLFYYCKSLSSLPDISKW